MPNRPLTKARIVKAVRHRVRKFGNRVGLLSRPTRRTFTSPTVLRQFAVTATSTAQRIDYRIAVPREFRLVNSIALTVPETVTAQVAVRRGTLRVRLTAARALPEGLIGWAVAALVTPGIRPYQAGGPDVHVAGTATSDAAHAGGHRLQFGNFSGADDAAQMEQQHAVTLADIRPTRSGFDPFTFNPIGCRIRLSALTPNTAQAALRRGPDGTMLTIGGQSYSMDDFAAAALKTFTGINLIWDMHTEVADIAAVAATGVVISAGSEHGDLHPDLQRLLREPLPSSKNQDDVVAWVVRSERQRRLALLHHSAAWKPTDAWPLVNILLATSRVQMLPDAVERALAQTYPHFDVHIALHGIDINEVPQSLRERDSRLVFHSFGKELNLGEIYGALTAQANGMFLGKFDDDDFYGPHHLWDAILASRYTGAGLVGRAPAMTWLSESEELLLRGFEVDEAYGQYIAGAAMVVNRAQLLQVGGWRPTPWAVDKALIDRFTSAGLATYRAAQMGWACVRHNQGHTWLREESHFREQAFASWTGADAQAMLESVLQG